MGPKKNAHFFFLIFFSFSKMATSEMATSLPGNTIAGKKARNYILTINEKSLAHYEEIKDYILNLKSNIYYLCCEHIGQENKHYHVYCQFKTPIKLSVKKLYGAHFEISFGSAQQNIAYVKAEDDKHKKLQITSKLIDEEGEPKFNGGFKTIKEVEEMSKEERKELPLQYKKIVDAINTEEDNDLDINDWYKEVQVVYIQGPSGCGKSLKAMKIIKKNEDILKGKFNEVNYQNGFWNGIGKAKACIYDDFRDSCMPANEFIKFIDYNVHTMNVKGGYKQNKYELIIITSVQPIETIYKNLTGEPREQWMRRTKVINFYKDIKTPEFKLLEYEN